MSLEMGITLVGHHWRGLAAFVLASLLAVAAHAGEAGKIVFVTGEIHVSGKPAVNGAAVGEGDEIVTGADGYLYLKTIDSGFFILRPNSRARILVYHVDPAVPANTRVKLELQQGVARSISGRAVHRSPEHFRFNTPVAAIGVRGTDFTVFTDSDVTRIVVTSGGIVASGFGGLCRPDGGGPCEGGTSRELFADQAGKVLQVRSDQPEPQLLQGNGNSPNRVAPPRQDEPQRKSASGDVPATGLLLDGQEHLGAAALEAAPSLPEPQYRPIIWGRWKPLASQPAQIDLTALSTGPNERSAVNRYYAVGWGEGANWTIPVRGTMSFAMDRSEAFVINQANGGAASLAAVENGRLNIDFARTTFSTGFDLVVSPREKMAFNASGDVTREGRLLGANQFSGLANMTVNGAVGPQQGGSAVYIFEGQIDNSRYAVGGISWVHK